MANAVGLLVVEQVRRERVAGTTITETITRVRGRLAEEPGVTGSTVIETDTRRGAALVAVTVNRPSALKRLAGDGIARTFRAVDSRTVADLARTHGPLIAIAAQAWGIAQHPTDTAATA